MRSPMLNSLHHYRAPSDGEEDSQSSSSNSPAHADYEESDFFEGNNDSQSSIGVPMFESPASANGAQHCNIYPPIDRLPAEILISVFNKLNMPSDVFHCMLVSKKWARNAVDLLWHRPSCLNIAKHTTICGALATEEPYFAYHDMIKRLNLAALASLVNDGSVVALAGCTRVERLTLTGCRGLTDAGVIGLIKGNSNLLALDASSVNEITDNTMVTLAAFCKRLQGLNISGCQNISSEALKTVAESCKYIKRIKLNNCSQLTDVAVLAIANSCRNILEIDLHQCKKIEDEPIIALLNNGQSLRELRLASCELITDGAFLSLPAYQTYEQLRILDLTSCSRLTDDAVERIIEAAPKLRNLVLAKCKNITDVAVNAISKLGKFLHYVHLGHCGQITDAAVIKLVKSCNRIRYIDLGCCTHLTDASITQLATLPKLRRIGLVKCSLITDESVFALANAHRTRRSILEARHPHLGDSRVHHHANSLERVHLSYCINLTLKSILVLLNNCPKLTHLSLTGVQAFIGREDLSPFCREAPSEFTDHQRNVFCVFSGAGVLDLRKYLNEQESVRLRAASAAGEDGGDEASGEEGGDDDDDDTVDGDEEADVNRHPNFPLFNQGSGQFQNQMAVIAGSSQGPILPQQHAQTQHLVQPHAAVLHDTAMDIEMTGMADVVGEMAIDTDPENGDPDDDLD